jgi:demethylmenaquinone methyltransferase/2-methoxy-6-polyprenyl-1,4-benzoquinol methylase
MSVTGLEEREARAAAAGGAIKRSYVRRMFSEIAPRYDLLNHLLSLNVDRRWRTRAIARLDPRSDPAARYLDLCAGTLDVGAQICHVNGFAGVVFGADFAEPMLRHGAGKAPAAQLVPVVADATDLPIRDRSMAGAIIAFGIRNVSDLDQVLSELARVLEPGGRVVILEFSTPRGPVLRHLYQFYLHRLLPVLAGMLSGHRTAYRYLPESVARFPVEEELAARMQHAGFLEVAWESLTAGVAAIHWAIKPREALRSHVRQR